MRLSLSREGVRVAAVDVGGIVFSDVTSELKRSRVEVVHLPQTRIDIVTHQNFALIRIFVIKSLKSKTNLKIIL